MQLAARAQDASDLEQDTAPVFGRQMVQDETGEDTVEEIVRVGELIRLALISVDSDSGPGCLDMGAGKHFRVDVQPDDFRVGTSPLGHQRQGSRSSSEVQYASAGQAGVFNQQPLESMLAHRPPHKRVVKRTQAVKAQSGQVRSRGGHKAAFVFAPMPPDSGGGAVVH